MKTGPPHVAMLATPGIGHVIPLAELAKRLASRPGATATLITFASTASATQRAFLASLPPSVASLPLPPVDVSDLPHDAAIETLMSEECARSLPALTGILSELRESTRLVAFVTDSCLFTPINLHAVSLLLHLPELAASVAGEFRDLAEPVRLSGCVPIPGPDIVSPLQDRSNPSYMVMVHLAMRHREADAILVNSFDAVEPEVAKVLRQPEPGRRRPPVYPIGPLIVQQSNGTTTNTVANGGVPPHSLAPRAACLEWLDHQPARSVIFVSFGSGGAIPKEEMHELALGLELSRQRFLWVVRSPSYEGTLSDNYYDAESKKDPFSPGAVVGTADTGWNSTLESLVHGVPMVAWPLFAEQRQNAVMLAEGAGAANRRYAVAELQKAAAEGLREGGAATMALDEVVQKWEADAAN
ncbi:hypothetical protein SORBI_3005G156600 [Sorghum bicolor]|uniref:Glycosyltransferase n=1 Tax=Sorghum bicolor TaxID=4558 RepID=C5Y4R5_SORBI|nr:hypothetical protein SORBI_3005G156600 [Sorghum bicolor]